MYFLEVFMFFKKLTASLLVCCILSAAVITPFKSNMDDMTIGNSILAEASEMYKPTTCALVKNSSEKDRILFQGNKYFSPNKKYYVIFESNGHLVVYDQNNNKKWSTVSEDNYNATCTLKQNGDLVISKSDNSIVWSSKTEDNKNASLYISDEGELFIYSDETEACTFSSKNNLGYRTYYSAITDFSTTDTVLNQGVKFLSPNKEYTVEFQKDGDLAVYYTEGLGVLWKSGTANIGNKCVMKSDGQLVIYKADGSEAWCTKNLKQDDPEYEPKFGDTALYLSNKGELCIYSSSNGAFTYSNQGIIANSDERDIELICGNRYFSPNNEYFAVFQKDGNLVVYDKYYNPKWNSETNNNGKKCVMKSNGNLVISNAVESTIWSSKSFGNKNSKLFLSDSGKLCIYSDSKNKYTYIANSKISIPDNKIQISEREAEKIDWTEETDYYTQYNAGTNSTYYYTGLSNFGQSSLMLRQVSLSAEITVNNMSEEELREHFRFYVQFMYNGKKGGERNLRPEKECLKIEKLNEDNANGMITYRLTEKNVPCFGDKVNFGIKTYKTDSRIDFNISDFHIISTDKKMKKYDVFCENGENLHIIMDYDFFTNDDMETWLRTMSRFVNSLSDITGVKRKDIYIFEYADALCYDPCKDEGMIPSSSIMSNPAIMVPSEKYARTCIDVQDSIYTAPKSIHLLYLHELSHCYAVGETFNSTFGCNLDDGNTNIRGITAMQNCEQLESAILFADNILKKSNLGTYTDAARNLADTKWNETVNFRIMNTFANYIERYNEDGWALLEKYFEGGDPIFNANLYSSDVQKIITNKLKDSEKISPEDKYKCDDLCSDSYNFINTLQFFQQNAREKAYNDAKDGMIKFIDDFVTYDQGNHKYKDAFVDYFERVEKNKRDIDDKWETGHYLVKTECVS